MVGRGVMQYGIFGAPRMWDMAAGALVVQEAGGTVMTRFKESASGTHRQLRSILGR